VSRVALALLAVLALATSGVAASGADFTATSRSPTTITAAADFNTVAVSLNDPGATLVGPVALHADASSNRGIASVRIQQAPTGTGDWVDICLDTTAPYDCTWPTTAVADGSYDLRATATDTAGYTRTATRSDRTVDNHTLTVSLADPGAMGGTQTLTATAANPTGGLAELTIQHRAAGAASWTTLCTGTTNPRSCDLDTTTLPEGIRELRAVARDGAGHVVQSTTITRTVDNTPPTATPSIPPTASGNVTMTAEASDSGSGIAYVAFEALYYGTWYEFCRDTSAPFTCSGDSAQVPDGTYSIRIVTVDNAGVATTSSPFPLVVDNTAPTGSSISNGNAGSAGQLGAGDWIRLTWSEQIAPASVMAGWDGSSQAVRVRVKDVGAADEMDFLTTGGTRLNLVLGAADLKLNANFVSSDAEFNATMTQSGAAITITLGTKISGTLATAGAGTITWRPSSAATDLSGNASGTATVTESGISDVDF
jgi:chitinase